MLTINNVSTSVNTADVIQPILRMTDPRKLAKYNSMTPSLPDNQYGVYSDAFNTSNNPLASFTSKGYDTDMTPRGAFPLDYVNIFHTTDSGGGESPTVTDELLISQGPTDTWVITVQVTVCEPFMALSPFLNNDSMNNSGLIGINALTVVLNIDSGCKKLWSSMGANVNADGSLSPYITSINLGVPAKVGPGMALAGQVCGFSNTRLLLNFLSLQPEQYSKMSTRSVTPYYDFPRYLTSNSNNALIPPGGSATISSSNLQLSQIPDAFIIVCRLPLAQQNWAYPNSFLAIKNIAVNFNNSSGILSTATQNSLFEISRSMGYCGTWLEWTGKANKSTATSASTIPTPGSVLVLSPALHFGLPPYLSSGSLGQYGFQVNIEVYNQYPYPITPELCIICQNSGFIVSEMGTSQLFTGILNKQMVLEAKEKESERPNLDTQTYERLVGGKLVNRGMAALGKLVKHFRKHKTGGEMSAGAMSGGCAPVSKATSRLAKLIK